MKRATWNQTILELCHFLGHFYKARRRLFGTPPPSPQLKNQSGFSFSRKALEQLIGRERATNSLQEVELAVQADLREKATPAASLTAPLTSSTPAPKDLTNSTSAPLIPASGGVVGDTSSAARSKNENVLTNIAPGGGGLAEQVSGDVRRDISESRGAGGVAGDKGAASAAGEGKGGGGGVGGYRLPEGQLGRFLGNERLAHEILVNPEFQVRERGKGPSVKVHRLYLCHLLYVLLFTRTKHYF